MCILKDVLALASFSKIKVTNSHPINTKRHEIELKWYQEDTN